MPTVKLICHVTGYTKHKLSTVPLLPSNARSEPDTYAYVRPTSVPTVANNSPINDDILRANT